MPVKKQKAPLYYSRKKGHIEIDGDPADVKQLVRDERYERITKWGIQLFLFLILLLKAGVSSPVLKTVEEVIHRFPICHLYQIIVESFRLI